MAIVSGDVELRTHNYIVYLLRNVQFDKTILLENFWKLIF